MSMSAFMDFLRRPLAIYELWDDLKYSKGILLTCATAATIVGFYLGCNIRPLDSLAKLCIVFALVLGVIGIFLIIYLMVLCVLAEMIYGGHVNRSTTADRSSFQLNGSHSTNYRIPPPPPPYELAVDSSGGFHETGTT